MQTFQLQSSVSQPLHLQGVSGPADHQNHLGGLMKSTVSQTPSRAFWTQSLQEWGSETRIPELSLGDPDAAHDWLNDHRKHCENEELFWSSYPRRWYLPLWPSHIGKNNACGSGGVEREECYPLPKGPVSFPLFGKVKHHLNILLPLETAQRTQCRHSTRS